MTTTPSPTSQSDQCRLLRQRVESEGGTHNLSHTDLAFYQTFCESDHQASGHRQATELEQDSGIDESAHIMESTSFGDPNAGRPDDQDEANPINYGRAVTQSPDGSPRPAK